MINRHTLRHGSPMLLALVLSVATAHAQFDCSGVAPTDNTDLQAVAVVSGLNGPVFASSPPGDTDRLFIVEQAGVIRLHKRGDAPGVTSVFLDISTIVKSGGEQGLLGLAFSPDFATSGHFYVNYSVGSALCGIIGGPCEQVISRFGLTADPDVADDASEVVLMQFDEPQTNHNGGWMEFGLDDMLYIATGDGGGANDAHGTCGNSQPLDNLLGKILRIDVLGIDPLGTAPDTTCSAGYTVGQNFTVPTDNPFTGAVGGDCDEIYQYGLRNPWRNSIDAANGDMYLADVGQNCWEEVNYVAAADAGTGINWGWRQMEGAHCFDINNPGNCDPVSASGCSPPCNDPSLTLPVLEYANPAVGDSVIGGYVYRGCRMANFQGTYFYGDNGTSIVRSFEISGGSAINQTDWTTQLGPAPGALTSFGQDGRGEVYLTDAFNGTLNKIMPPFADLEVSGTGAADMFLLSRTGDWTWEDLQFNTMHPVDYYQVYRGTPNGTFDCIHSTTSTSWPAGGDTTDPAPGALQAYLVTAVNGGAESSSGNPPRTLGAACSPP